MLQLAAANARPALATCTTSSSRARTSGYSEALKKLGGGFEFSAKGPLFRVGLVLSRTKFVLRSKTCGNVLTSAVGRLPTAQKGLEDIWSADAGVGAPKVKSFPAMLSPSCSARCFSVCCLLMRDDGLSGVVRLCVAPVLDNASNLPVPLLITTWLSTLTELDDGSSLYSCKKLPTTALFILCLSCPCWPYLYGVLYVRMALSSMSRDIFHYRSCCRQTHI